MQSHIFGSIAEARRIHSNKPDLPEDYYLQIEQNTDNVLQSLPDSDIWPPLTRNFFAVASSDDGMITYDNRYIHFAASFNTIDWEFRDWLDKFEHLLSKLHWESAYVQLQGAHIGRYEFTWWPTKEWKEKFVKGILEPTAEWIFSSSQESNGLDKLSSLDADDLNSFREHPAPK